MKKFLISILFLVSNWAVNPAVAEVRNARVYKIGDETKILFTQTTEISEISSEIRTWVSVLKDSAGKILMTESANIKNGKIQNQKVQQFQVGESYELQVANDQATFKEFQLLDSANPVLKKTEVVSVGESFIMGPTTDFFVQKNWKALTEGAIVKAEFGVFELLKTVQFEFKKIEDEVGSIKIQMKPANLFVSMMVDPIYVTYDKTTQKMIRYKGRTPMRIKVDGKWKPLDADIFYP